MEKMLEAEIWTVAQTREGCAVLLRPRNENVAVPIFVGQLEIQSILIGKEGLSLPRPLTHDLFLNLLDSQGLALDRVEIHELKENTFHARLVITGRGYSGENPLVLDSRPSDAFGLATRQKCPILVSPEIVRQTGISLDLFIDIVENESGEAGGADQAAAESGGNISPLDVKRRRLLKQLNDAVDKEEYEKAAEIRDMLREMEN